VKHSSPNRHIYKTDSLLVPDTDYVVDNSKASRVLKLVHEQRNSSLAKVAPLPRSRYPGVGSTYKKNFDTTKTGA